MEGPVCSIKPAPRLHTHKAAFSTKGSVQEGGRYREAMMERIREGYSCSTNKESDLHKHVDSTSTKELNLKRARVSVALEGCKKLFCLDINVGTRFPFVSWKLL